MHPMERRANALAEGFTKRVDLMAAMLRPDDRLLFHQRLSHADALQFWQKHRWDDKGQQIIATYTPDQILDLDRTLMQANESTGIGGPPVGMG
jgi:hypothetical protein